MKKLNFRKVTSILSCGLMAISTIGFAAAASYPAPFVLGGSANVAIVYGTGSGVSSLDVIQAGNIQTNLQSYLGGGTSASTSSASGGDSFKIEKSSTKFWLGRNITDVVSTSITDDNLPTLLADGVYTDDDNDEKDYTQKIDMASALTLQMFDDNDYAEDEPTVGIRIANGAHVLNYTLDFTDTPEWGDLDSTTIEIMGKEYFILSHTENTTINLLDSAQTTTLSEGETATVNGHEVSISFIGSSEVKLNVDGEITNSLQETHTQKLSGGDYIGIKDISVQDYAGGTKSVEFSIGTGKLVLKDATDIEINDDSISNLKTWFTSSTSSGNRVVDKVVIEWKAEDDLFVTPDSEVTMPGFEAVKLSMASMYYPTEETITLKHGSSDYISLDNFPLKTSTEDIPLLYSSSGAITGIGKDSDNVLVVNVTDSVIFDDDSDDWFVASYNDGTTAESYLVDATSMSTSDSGVTNKTTIRYRDSGAWTTAKSDAVNGDSVTIGNVELTVNAIHVTDKTVNISASGTYVDFNTLYSNEGMQIYLPYQAGSGVGYINLSDTNNASAYSLVFAQEDRNGNVGAGAVNITANISFNSNNEIEVLDVIGESVGFQEIDDTDTYRSFIYDATASELLWDKSADQYFLKINYHGDESYGEVYITAPSTTITGGTSGTTGSGTQLGEVLVKDTEVSSVSSKNLIIVGGSCINSAAATALGVSQGTCGSAFTTATGVGSGQFLIKGVSGAYSTGKIALVVAGYEAADTVNAAKYLTTQSVDTSKEYKGTSSTSATLVTTTA